MTQSKAAALLFLLVIVTVDLVYGPRGLNRIVYPCLAGMLVLLQVLEWLSRRYPRWAWEHGASFMQQAAIPVLAARVQPGMTFPQVLAVLARGSAGWPDVVLRELQPEDTVSFRTRADAKAGIGVLFRDGQVAAVVVVMVEAALDAKA